MNLTLCPRQTHDSHWHQFWYSGRESKKGSQRRRDRQCEADLLQIQNSVQKAQIIWKTQWQLFHIRKDVSILGDIESCLSSLTAWHRVPCCSPYMCVTVTASDVTKIIEASSTGPNWENNLSFNRYLTSNPKHSNVETTFHCCLCQKLH